MLQCGTLRRLPRTKLAALSTIAALTSASGSAHATPGITGYSGKPYNGATETCNTVCHGGNGTPPTLDITVPSTMAAGETAEVTIVVNGTRARTSLNAALSDGVTAAKGQNTDIPFPIEAPGEVAAVIPPPSGANGTYKFTFVAPNKNGPITLWVAGMSASGSGTGGDGVRAATRTITVTGATAPAPDAGPTTTDDDAGAGPSATTDGGAMADGGSSRGGEDDEGDEGAISGDRGQRGSSGEDAGGCSSARATTPCASALGAAALVGLGLVLSRRRASGKR